MPIEVIDKIKQKNGGTFKLMDAKDIAIDDTDIENYAKKIKEESEKLNKELVKKINSDNVYNKNEIDTKIFHMDNMGQDVKEAMTGGSVAVVGENSIDTVNLKDNSTTLEKLSPNVQNCFRYKINFKGKEIRDVSNSLKAYSGSLYINLKCFASNDGFVETVNLFAMDIGRVTFFIGSVVDTTFTPRERFSVDIQKKGLNELEINKYIKEGEFLGVWYEKGSILGYSQEEGGDVGSYLYATVSSDSFKNVVCNKANRWLYYNLKLKTIQQPLTVVGKDEIEDGAVTITKMDNDLLKGFKLESTIIGKDISTNKPENKTISSAFYLNKNAISPKDGFLDTINFYASSQGEIQFCIGSYAQDIFTPRIWLETIIVTDQGINTHKINRNIYINEGECIGAFVKSGSPLMYGQSGDDIYYYKGNVTDTFNSLSLLKNSTAWIFYNYKLKNIANYDKDIKNILENILNLKTTTQKISECVNDVKHTRKNEQINKTSLTIMEEILDFSNVSEWDNVGFQLGESLVGQNGSILTNKKLYGIDNRIIRVELSFTDNTSIAEIGSIPNSSNLPYVGTSIRLDATDNTLKLMRYSTSSERNDHVVERRELGFSLLNHKIYLEIEKNGRRMDFRVGQVDGTGYYETFYINTIESGNYYPIGTLQGFPYLSTIAGEVSYTYFLHTAKCKKKPLLYIIGDSITEGYRVKDDLRWTTLLKNMYGEDEVCVSGIGGSKADEGLKRIKSEIINIEPKNVIYFMGTNSFSSTSIVKESLDYLSNKGARVFQVAIPKFTWNEQKSYMLAKYFIRLDSVLRDSSGVINDYYQSDKTHPNEVGSNIIFNKVIKDINVKLK